MCVNEMDKGFPCLDFIRRKKPSNTTTPALLSVYIVLVSVGMLVKMFQEETIK